MQPLITPLTREQVSVYIIVSPQFDSIPRMRDKQNQVNPQWTPFHFLGSNKGPGAHVERVCGSGTEILMKFAVIIDENVDGWIRSGQDG